jgi:hypothetical protein
MTRRVLAQDTPLPQDGRQTQTFEPIDEIVGEQEHGQPVIFFLLKVRRDRPDTARQRNEE